MNFLAHIFLSGQDEDLIIGNFIADSIKGRKYLNYPEGIRNGILLHRAIDSYTDSHSTVRRSTARLFKNYSHYSGVLVDIFYDHFLAANWDDYSGIPLEDFISEFYILLQPNFSRLPAPVQRFMPYMIQENWLLSYSSHDGIKRILYQMNQRTKNRVGMDRAGADLREHYTSFEKDFREFFPELQQFCIAKIEGF